MVQPLLNSPDPSCTKALSSSPLWPEWPDLRPLCVEPLLRTFTQVRLSLPTIGPSGLCLLILKEPSESAKQYQIPLFFTLRLTPMCLTFVTRIRMCIYTFLRHYWSRACFVEKGRQ